MPPEAKRRVVRRVTKSGALPVSRDAPGYAAVLGVLGVVDCCEGIGKEGAGVGAGVDATETSARAGESMQSHRNFRETLTEFRSRVKYTPGGFEPGTVFFR